MPIILPASDLGVSQLSRLVLKRNENLRQQHFLKQVYCQFAERLIPLQVDSMLQERPLFP